MCGIFGAFGLPKSEVDLSSVFNALKLRGPDDSGAIYHDQYGVLLGHTRLAIHDLSALGHQPMLSASGRYQIVFNGEVYNYRELKRDLEAAGFSFRGGSDTEVMLACFDHWGVAEALKQFKGMFAFALLDLRDGRLYLSRDRMGEKPLYYYVKNGVYVWASNLNALKAICGSLEISHKSLAKFLRYGYIPSPHCIYHNVYKVEPATLITIKLASARDTPTVDRYWDAQKLGEMDPLCFDSDLAAVNALQDVLKASVESQMDADVPLGAFLSGGVDSSLIVALMQSFGGRPVKTFSMGFDDPRYNEAPFARDVARFLKTDHTEYIVTAQDALDVIPQLASIYDEPFADWSQIPTCLVSAIAKRQVTVALSGDGGDELFHGYKRYARTDTRFKQFNQPGCVMLGSGLSLMPLWLRQWLSTASRGKLSSRQILALGHLLSESDQGRFYHSSISSNLEAEAFVVGVAESDSHCSKFESFNKEFPRDYAFNDLVTYLPDDILVKVDRAAMSQSLETRVPLLDRDVVEFAMRLPMSMKIRDGKSKWLLRQLLYKYVPARLIDRPKRGFSIPINDWLRNDLHEWASDLLASENISKGGYFDTRLVGSIWKEHQSGKNSSAVLWPILMFQKWLSQEK
jgi:asparagine synthase (glutamine-hydrolysing)